MNKNIWLGITLILVIIAIVVLEINRANPGISGNQTIETGNQLAPELQGITGYINTDNITIASLKGKVVLVDFWTYSCVNCLRTLPYLNAWYQKYGDQGLVIIGVHTPEFNFEKDYNNVQAAVNKYGIKYPVVLDSNYGTWNAYQNQYWPRHYLIDRQGYIRFDHIGEGGYDETEQQIKQLLAENGQIIQLGLVNISDTTPNTYNTPELYIGFAYAIPRGENIGNSGGLKPGVSNNYKISTAISADTIYLEGPWISESEDALANSYNSSITLKFTAKNVNIVASANETGNLYIYLDGKPIDQSVAGPDVKFDNGIPYIPVLEPRLYNIYTGPYGQHTLKLTAENPGFKFNTFTFG